MFKLSDLSIRQNGLKKSVNIALGSFFVASGLIFLLFMASTVVALFEKEFVFAFSSFVAAAALAQFLIFTKSLLEGAPRLIKKIDFFLGLGCLLFFLLSQTSPLFLAMIAVIWMHALLLLLLVDRLHLLVPENLSRA